jgi:hypothetical protein
MCYNVEEIMHHLFTNCQYIKEICCYIYVVNQNNKNISTNYRNGRCQFILDTAQDKHWKRMEVVTCFVIWHERCMREFHEENMASLIIVKEILLEYQN